MPPPKKDRASAETRTKAKRELEKARKSPSQRPSSRRVRATTNALKREGQSAASPEALASHARAAARRRGPQERHQSAMKAVHTKGPKELKEEVSKSNKDTLSIDVVKKAAEIEKLAKSVKDRMRG